MGSIKVFQIYKNTETGIEYRVMDDAAVSMESGKEIVIMSDVNNLMAIVSVKTFLKEYELVVK